MDEQKNHWSLLNRALPCSLGPGLSWINRRTVFFQRRFEKTYLCKYHINYQQWVQKSWHKWCIHNYTITILYILSNNTVWVTCTPLTWDVRCQQGNIFSVEVNYYRWCLLWVSACWLLIFYFLCKLLLLFCLITDVLSIIRCKSTFTMYQNWGMSNSCK